VKDSPCFVGRTDERAQLAAGLASAGDGQGGLFLISGEAGVGKTRLAMEAAAAAAQMDFTVLWGHCEQDQGAPAYWPWTQILRAARGADNFAAVIDDAARWLDAFLPEFAAGRADDVGPPARVAVVPSYAESERARLRLFDAVVELLRHACGKRPSLLLFDDLHSADLPSLSLLQVVARSSPEMELLIVATQRPSDARVAHHGSDLLATLDRMGTRLVLRGWNPNEVRQYVEDIIAAPPTRLIEVVHEASRGNPLIVDGIARIVRDHPDVEMHDGFPFGVRIPDTVRDVLRAGCQQLPAGVRRILDAAAVIGLRFDVHVLAAVVECAPDEMREDLERLLRAGIFVECPGESGVLRFAQPLQRDVAHAEIDDADRRRLHRRVAVGLATGAADHLDEHACAIAHHYFEAGARQDIQRAISSVGHAAARASRQCAYEEAVRQYRRALAALDPASDDEELRCELMVLLGEAHLRAGHVVRARQVCREAAQMARGLGLGELLARAALACGGMPGEAALVDPEVTGLLEESRRFLGPEPTPLKSIVSARLASAMRSPADSARRALLCREAIDAARLAESDEAMAHALDARHQVYWEQTDLHGQVAVADQIIDAAERCGNDELLLHGIGLRLSDFLEMGDIDAVDSEIKRYERISDETQQALYRFRSRLHFAMRALLDGSFDRAERLIGEALEIGGSVPTLDAATLCAVSGLALERQRGRAGSAEANLLGLLEAFPSVGALRIALGAFCADVGRRDDAAAAFARVAANGFAAIPMDSNWLISVALAADVCAFLGDKLHAAALFAMLQPFADRNAIGSAGGVCSGCVSRQLGLLAELLGQPDEAFGYFENAIARDARMGARPFVLRSMLDLAALLTSQAGAEAGFEPEPHMRARALAQEVQREALTIGMERTAERAASLLDRLG